MEQKLKVQIKVYLRSASYISSSQNLLNYLTICFYLVYQGEEEKIPDGIFAELTDTKEEEERRSSDGIFAELTDNKEAEVALSMEVEVYTFSLSPLCV